ncbi:hypothetical protein ABZW49_10635 [Nonomuraea wenchangensis]
MSAPPYWPFRCATCKRFVSNPRVRHNASRITKQWGDCSRCGEGVDLVPLSWEDWFDDDYDPEEAVFVAAGLLEPSEPQEVAVR